MEQKRTKKEIRQELSYIRKCISITEKALKENDYATAVEYMNYASCSAVEAMCAAADMGEVQVP